MNKYERCVLKVKAKQTPNCVKHNYKAYLDDPTTTTKPCYSPFAVCSRLRDNSTVKKTTKKKSKKNKTRSRVRNRSKSKKKTIYHGPRGGRYYLKQGRKVYIK